MIRIARYTKAPEEPTPGWIESAESALDQLGRMLSPLPEWYLTGGLAIDLGIGGWTRQHDDADIMLPEGALRDFGQLVGQHGYRLMQAVTRRRVVGRKLTLYRPAVYDDKVRLSAVNGTERNPLLSSLDVFLYFECDGTVRHCTINLAVPVVYKNGVSYRTRSGYVLPCMSLDYMRAVKDLDFDRGFTAKDAHDMRLMNAALNRPTLKPNDAFHASIY